MSDQNDTTLQIKENSQNTTSDSTTSCSYAVLLDGVFTFVDLNQARTVIEEQQRQIQNYNDKIAQIDSNSELIKKYFGKTTDINRQILDRYRKLLTWIQKGGVYLLFLSLLLVAIPLGLFIWKFNNDGSLDSLKTILSWLVGIYACINIGGLFTWGISSFGLKQQLDSIDKRIDRIEDKVYK
ncbi:MAG: hypothetical protein Q7J16_01845 [Candidatus Cloacimonadales bacterium]|nr:hypothetical protein [Candidatus Cloacimonadales bacterium]